MGLIDSHAHLDYADYVHDLDGVVARARAAGLERIVCVGLWRKPGDFGNALELATARSGLLQRDHRHPPARGGAGAGGGLGDRGAGSPRIRRVVAVGETGLDYHYDHSPRADQSAAFRRSIGIARDAAKPLVVHVREADADCAAMLREEGVPPRAASSTASPATPPPRAPTSSSGSYISVAGDRDVQDRRARSARRSRIVPRDRLLVETDSPFLAPVPFRGKRNEPAHVVQRPREGGRAVGDVRWRRSRRLDGRANVQAGCSGSATSARRQLARPMLSPTRPRVSGSLARAVPLLPLRDLPAAPLGERAEGRLRVHHHRVADRLEERHVGDRVGVERSSAPGRGPTAPAPPPPRRASRRGTRPAGRSGRSTLPSTIRVRVPIAAWTRRCRPTSSTMYCGEPEAMRTKWPESRCLRMCRIAPEVMRLRRWRSKQACACARRSSA